MTATVGVLGPLSVSVDGCEVPLAGGKQRSLLGALLLRSDEVVSVDWLVAALWGDEAGDNSASTLQVHVSNLRRSLDPLQRALGGEPLVRHHAPGYRICLPGEALDTARVLALSREGRAAADAARPEDAASAFRRALALWRGELLADVPEGDWLVAERSRWSALHRSLESDLVDAELDCGRHHELVGRLRAEAHRHPYDERLWGQLMIALYRSGQQAEALVTYRRARSILVEELGIEPGPALRDLERQVLEQDPALDGPSRGRGVADSATILHSSRAVPAASLRSASAAHPLVRPVTTIGRSADRDIVVAERDVSRHHAEIRASATGYLLVDNGSSNGTKLNGRYVRRADLVPGDVISIGTQDFVFDADQR
jgi:SARP family transcriptional regulator, regulator of embCAB operon